LIAARALAGWTRADLAKRSGTSKDTVFAFEGRNSNPKLGTVQAWIGALQRAGVILLDEDDDHGPGVAPAQAALTAFATGTRVPFSRE
jgi:transcriptional regulator with XRE-family HTH domain